MSLIGRECAFFLKPQLFVRDGYPGSLEYSSAEDEEGMVPAIPALR